MRNQPKEQTNHNQPIPMRNQPKEHREIKTNSYPREINPMNTQRNQNPRHKHNPKLQKSNSTNKSTNPRFMRRKEIEH